MRTLACYIIPALLFISCQNKTEIKPVWLNESASISFPDLRLEFKTVNKNWVATLITFAQPIKLSTKYENGKILVSQAIKKGVIEGPAKICLSHDDKKFYYAVNITNKELLLNTPKDYRSPKTVNPDSSLNHQSIVHNIDVYRNLVALPKTKQYFFEAEISLAPKAAIYRAIKEQAVTSYYVQPGSCIRVPVKSVYKKTENVFNITVGPLADQYNNTISDGTLVAFIYSDTKYTWRMEAITLKGFTNVIIHVENNMHYTLQAKVNQTISTAINLIPE